MRSWFLVALLGVTLMPTAPALDLFVAFVGEGSGSQHTDEIAPNPNGDRTCTMQWMTLDLRWSIWSVDGWDMNWVGAGGCIADFNSLNDLKGTPETGFFQTYTVKEGGVDCYIYTVSVGPIGPATEMSYRYEDRCGPGRYIRTTTGTFNMG